MHHDTNWIELQLLKIPEQYRDNARSRYWQLYDDAYQAEPMIYKKMGAGRNAANSKLRLYVDKVK